MFRTEILPARAAGQILNAWKDLAFRCLEPNIFFESEFALPALNHLAEGNACHIVVAWDETKSPPRLMGLLPCRLPRFPLRACRAFVPNQAALGTPLIDRGAPDEIFEAMLAAIRRFVPRQAILVLPLVPTAGPICSLLERSAARRRHKLAVFDMHKRAILSRPFANPLSPKAAGELRRQRRRLAETGVLTYRRRQDASGVAKALEAFLAIEAKGWKGRRKSALIGSPRTLAFAQALARQMGAAGKLAVDSLELDGRPIAMGVLFTTGDRAYFWKIAYDEDFASRSPGVLFTEDLTRRQITDPSIALTDSCAQPNHPMIDRLWPGRLSLADVAVPLHASRFAVAAALAREQIRRKLRAWLKFLLILARARLRN